MVEADNRPKGDGVTIDRGELDEARQHATAPGAALGGRIVSAAFRRLVTMPENAGLSRDDRAKAVETYFADLARELKHKGVETARVEDAVAWARRDYRRYFGAGAGAANSSATGGTGQP